MDRAALVPFKGTKHWPLIDESPSFSKKVLGSSFNFRHRLKPIRSSGKYERAAPQSDSKSTSYMLDLNTRRSCFLSESISRYGGQGMCAVRSRSGVP